MADVVPGMALMAPSAPSTLSEERPGLRGSGLLGGLHAAPLSREVVWNKP